jgi:hypothetical protein
VNITPTTQTQGVGPDSGADEVQKISFSNTPTSGNWVLSFNSNPSPTLAYNSSALDVQNALNTIVGLGGVTVSGNFTVGFTVTFAGVNGLTNQSPLLVQSNTLFANAAPVTITPCSVTLGDYPADNLKDAGTNPVSINSTVLVTGVNPEPNWFAGAIIC